MIEETKTDAVKATDTAAAAAPAVAETAAKTTAKTSAAAKPTRAAKAAKPAKRRGRPVSAKVVEAVKKTNRRATTARGPRQATASAAPLFEGTKTMNTDFTKPFAGFELPGADRFQSLFADAGSRGQELAGKTRETAGEITEIAKANVEALAEAGRIAAAGARTIGQDVLTSGRDGIEQASNGFKALAQASSPTEYFQLQSELVRTSFDRMVAEGSKFTESLVKLAGEAIQPISNRASVNAERVNELMA